MSWFADPKSPILNRIRVRLLRLFFSTSPPRLLGRFSIWIARWNRLILLYSLKQSIFLNFFILVFKFMILCGSCILKRWFRVRFFFNISSETTGTITDLKTGSNVVFTPLLPKTNDLSEETHFGIAIHRFVWFVHWLFMIWPEIHDWYWPFIGVFTR